MTLKEYNINQVKVFMTLNIEIPTLDLMQGLSNFREMENTNDTFNKMLEFAKDLLK